MPSVERRRTATYPPSWSGLQPASALAPDHRGSVRRLPVCVTRNDQVHVGAARREVGFAASVSAYSETPPASPAVRRASARGRW